MQWLSPLNFFAKQKETFHTLQKDISHWLLEADDFRDWASETGTGTALWCHGPGKDCFTC